MSTLGNSDGERLARLETEVAHILKNQKEYEEDYAKSWAAVNGKLDEILALRNKGIGAFWVASSLIGTGIVSFVWQLFDWLKHGAG